MNSGVLIQQDSGNVEYYTPSEIVSAARFTMGGIDLDPASSPTANKVVLASKIFTAADDGLSYPWAGNVWMNHPFGDPENPCKTPCKKKTCKNRGYCVDAYKAGNMDWISKLVLEYKAGRVKQACCITFTSTDAKWYHLLLDYPICFMAGRTNYFLPDGSRKKSGPTKGSCVTYMGPNIERFTQFFSPLGQVMIPA